MTCEGFAGRLYDEDVRQALAGGGGPPPDLRPHLDACATCREEWEAAREDALLLRAHLEEPAPPHLQAAVAQTWTATRAAGLRAIDWAAALSWASAAGVMAVGSLRLLGGSAPPAWSAAAFALAATGAFALQVTAALLADAASGHA